MPKRKIIEIERDKCDGCGICTEACAEGALILDEENKVVLANEIFCDGMGACLDVCPTGALKVVERESAGYDSKATYSHVLKTRGQEAAAHVHGIHHQGIEKEVARPQTSSVPTGCPGSLAREIKRDQTEKHLEATSLPSALSQWPIQLHLISPYAPYFKDSHLLIAADCTAFALGSFHRDILKGKRLIIACPKLDDTAPYVEKIAEILRQKNIASLTVAVMVGPVVQACTGSCSGLSSCPA